MVPRMRLLVVLGIFAFSCISLAQESSTTAKVPACAQKCLLKEFATKTCGPIDQTCICTNEQFQTGVTLCLSTNCTIPESLAMKNISSTNCGAPVRDRGSSYTVLSYVLIILAAIFVIMRMAFKLFDGHELGLDDWSMILTVAVGLANTVVIVSSTIPNGLGKDLWTLTPKQITTMLKSFYIQAFLYFAELALLKMSLLFFYIRVFPGKGVQRVLWGTVAFTAAWGICFIIVAIFQCQPINYFWNKWDGLHKGTCLDINSVTSSNAAISIALDFWSLGIPLFMLWGLKMHWKKKIGVAMMFCVGTFITIVSILRLQALVHFAASSNVSWEFYDVSMWSTIEVGVGIMCACLPTLRLLLVKLFPILGGSSARSGQQYRNYGSGNELGHISKKSQRSRHDASRHTASGLHSGSTTPGKGDGMIVVETSYTVKRSNSDDERSLITTPTRTHNY
ncbi:GPCR, PTH11-type [Setomelanomma holmii]|uniref:GPCR, PTH11-type n=1 Tax=Setomelanomma holmii TaxID=210430 RepID=A0A9P4LQL6_9PLEO|nr:GPCR, PTH11-type [Setomelanomma holmii]